MRTHAGGTTRFFATEEALLTCMRTARDSSTLDRNVESPRRQITCLGVPRGSEERGLVHEWVPNPTTREEEEVSSFFCGVGVGGTFLEGILALKRDDTVRLDISSGLFLFFDEKIVFSVFLLGVSVHTVS